MRLMFCVFARRKLVTAACANANTGVQQLLAFRADFHRTFTVTFARLFWLDHVHRAVLGDQASEIEHEAVWLGTGCNGRAVALTMPLGRELARAVQDVPESELALLEDKLFRVRVLDTGGEALYTFRSGLFRPVFQATREPDLAFAANLSAYLQLLTRQEDPDTLFFNRELEITGDTELGLIVKNMLDAVEWPNLPQLPLLRG